jgi:hypothetical protein
LKELYSQKTCGNNVVKSIVYVEYYKGIQLHRRNAKRSGVLILEARRMENESSMRHKSPEMNKSRGPLLFQTADRVCCKGVSGLEFRVPQGFCFKE